ncbi:MAG: endonuclease III [Bacteroidetes bacterium]|nr:endonuclease III [Bacteroidota bacterium]MBP7400151.1 endonuclease III [Chitinophagales bacterium]MBK8682285.1 endonuclease III [Bacteroidota bacterium]MBP8754877.1 endonuclease III [Chitinophagales bacterium]MBP9190601.1 endonuclease III [Chitinophagales bacterium]
MNKKEKATFITDTLNELFPSPEIPLQHTDAFTLLISVLLSAQCTDVRVNQVTPFLFAKASTPFEMQKLQVEEIEKIIKSCGLGPAKSKAIKGLSEILVNNYNGEVPATFEDLETLPGVGHKTASVVMSQAFGIPAFPVDTHIHRLAYRWGLSNGKSVVKTESDLKKIFPIDSWNKLHLQIIYFGRTYCPARGHHIENCPICRVLNKKGR